MNAFHRIFNASEKFVCDVPWKRDENYGLPDWYFNGEYFAVQIYPDKDLVEWVPDCGPAPVWQAKFSEFADNTALLTNLKNWAAVTY